MILPFGVIVKRVIFKKRTCQYLLTSYTLFEMVRIMFLTIKGSKRALKQLGASKFRVFLDKPKVPQKKKN